MQGESARKRLCNVVVKPLQQTQLEENGAPPRGAPCLWIAVRNMITMGVLERLGIEGMGYETRSDFNRYHVVSPDNGQEVIR